MLAKITLAHEAIALAQKHVAALKELAPQKIALMPELNELEMGLEWSLKRAEAIRARLEASGHHNKAGPQ